MLPAWLAARFLELLHRAAADTERRSEKNAEAFELCEVTIQCLEEQLEQQRTKRAGLIDEAREIATEQNRIQCEIVRAAALLPEQ